MSPSHLIILVPFTLDFVTLGSDAVFGVLALISVVVVGTGW